MQLNIIVPRFERVRQIIVDKPKGQGGGTRGFSEFGFGTFQSEMDRWFNKTSRKNAIIDASKNETGRKGRDRGRKYLELNFTFKSGTYNQAAQ